MSPHSNHRRPRRSRRASAVATACGLTLMLGSCALLLSSVAFVQQVDSDDLDTRGWLLDIVEKAKGHSARSTMPALAAPELAGDAAHRPALTGSGFSD